MSALKTLLCLGCILFLTGKVAAQWEEEEQEYVRQTAESQSLSAIEVYYDGRLKRTYFYDFYKRYTGYQNAVGDGKIGEGEVLQYDDQNYLIEETSIDNEGTERNTFYHYYLDAFWSSKEECSTYAMLDSVTRERTGKKNVRCTYTKTFLNEDRLPEADYFVWDSVLQLSKKYFYEQGRLIKTAHYSNTTSKHSPLPDYFTWYTYNGAGQKTEMNLQADEVIRLKQRWEYDAEGRLETLSKFNVQYGAPHKKTNDRIIRTGPPTILADENPLQIKVKFRYDKKGRVAEVQQFYGEKPGMTLNFKYKAPKQ